MQTKEVFQDKTVTVETFTQALCALVKEQLIGIVTGADKSGFTFSLPGGVRTFHVRITEEERLEEPEKEGKK